MSFPPRYCFATTFDRLNNPLESGEILSSGAFRKQVLLKWRQIPLNVVLEKALPG